MLVWHLTRYAFSTFAKLSDRYGSDKLWEAPSRRAYTVVRSMRS